MVPAHQSPLAVCPQVPLQEPQVSQESQPQRQQQPQPFPLQVSSDLSVSSVLWGPFQEAETLS